ncbi:response regulator [Desertifilum sp. FACHB-1129]|uniref:Two-component system response regulator n=2 Tax=Desertifilum tharense IPPAS B-1220 TaxID=1781255 RepID=A0A1E5QM97_9CYAN|nr:MULTISPECIES: response regulator [Desertifilum]MCD8487547.1 response regulator [Desertifilum sp.]MDA0213359.1 response regulator [Cyanobacteria bacterium FC1]MDI9634395.1 response regulator [Geitlerinema splendidum]MDK3155702.1 response regulator [Kamptonema cortianum]MDL5047061.1 response regulator [Oscillatoria amoena NRMC-F 0135]
MRNLQPILLVEDDRVDRLTVQRALKEIEVKNPVDIAANGEEALALLRDRSYKKPAIILLDLNMPKMNGLEFLREIKQDADLKHIPVIVLTTSGEDRDKLESFNLCVAGYMIKPLDYFKFVEMLRAIQVYWTFSELP